ncbi:MAG: 1-acyl-sn-glycerol-3-phosphate acyltransferase, partial [Candidatus Hydrogenedentes bacterium]|nr:1-acyl-sn-glycerol-3-phosphate acyltransferase [Candidatus Hydrogenedentota bacterium]
MKHTIFDTPVLRPVLRFLSLLLLRAIGWKQGGQAPEAAKYVLIAAPHTSNWDYLLLMAITLRFKVKLYWMGKDTLFKPPYGWLVKYLGGIPIDRSKKT